MVKYFKYKIVKEVSCMSGYLNSRKLTNVKGRIKYITNEKKQENIVDYYNTTDNNFWRMLAKESQQRHKEVNAGGKCCESRELIIGIPKDSKVTAKEICEIFKEKYQVECTCAIHQNNKNEVVNRHCHLIFSERLKLNKPETTEEKKATRNYYYDEKGNKCKKADAVKIVKKGTILQKKAVRNFTEKNEYFKSQKFIYECKEIFLKDLLKIEWSLDSERRNKELSEKHIGKNNPKEIYIKQNNHLKSIVKNVCNASDFVMNTEKGTSLKELKSGYDINNFSIKNYEENEKKVYSFVKEMQSLYITKVKKEVKAHNIINSDLNMLNKEEYIFEPVQDQILNDYEKQVNTRSKPKVIDFIKNKLKDMINRIEKLVNIQDLLYIESNKKVKVYQDKRNNNLYIEDSDYLKEKKQRYYDGPEL